MSRQPKRPPRLPASAFAPLPQPTKRQYPLSLIDAHIHLWHSSILKSSFTDIESRQTLPGGANLDFYANLTTKALAHNSNNTKLEGFVYVQAEADHDDSDLDGSKGGWEAAIAEIDSVCNQALESIAPKLLGLVPWAPLHAGSQAVESFVERLKSLPSFQKLLSVSAPKDGRLIKGFRYLLQDSPAGTCTTDAFIDGLKWLGENGYVFDMTLDAGARGQSVLDEAIECISAVHSGQSDESKQTSFILDHLSKPDLSSDPTLPLSASAEAYIRSYFSLSLLPNVYIKLSGLLAAAPPELVSQAFSEYLNGDVSWKKRQSVSSVKSVETSADASSSAVLKRRIVTVLESLLEAFGDSRVVVGSDWPMFRPNCLQSAEPKSIEEEAKAWLFGFDTYQHCLTDLGLEGESLDRVFALNATTFYNL